MKQIRTDEFSSVLSFPRWNNQYSPLPYNHFLLTKKPLLNYGENDLKNTPWALIKHFTKADGVLHRFAFTVIGTPIKTMNSGLQTRRI